MDDLNKQMNEWLFTRPVKVKIIFNSQRTTKLMGKELLYFGVKNHIYIYTWIIYSKKNQMYSK